MIDGDRSAQDRALLAELFPYNPPMPCRVNVRIKGVSKPDMIEHGESITKDDATNEYTVKDATGEIIGWFKGEAIEGWWLEREPLNIDDLSPKAVNLIMAEIVKTGIKMPDGSSTRDVASEGATDDV